MGEITRLSYSSLSLWLNCQRAFYYRYIRQLPAVLSGRMLAGRCYDHGVSYALKRKMAGEIATPEEITDIISDRWESELSERVVYNELGEPKVEAKEVDWQGDEPGRLRDTVISLAGIYLEKMVPKLEPVAVQERLEGIVGGVPFLGYPDCVLSNDGVIDHKFAQKKMPQKVADKDLQMSSYATLLQKPIWAVFHQALDQKTLDINQVFTERNQADIDWFSVLASTVWQSIQTGIFPPNPTSWKCGEKECPYWVECRVLMED